MVPPMPKRMLQTLLITCANIFIVCVAGYRIAESSAILIYLASAFSEAGDNWLPSDPASAAPIHSALHCESAACAQLVVR
jgi:hypothetical protein